MSIVIHRDPGFAPNEAQVEIVERKGLGHPDSICDAIAEEFSRRLCLIYQERAGHVLHHNVDKALLAAGSSEPCLGGGRVIAPARLVLAGRAALDVDGGSIDVDGLASDVARGWLRENLHAFDSEAGMQVSVAVRPGSAELVDLFGAEQGLAATANDSSCGVGYAPLSDLERMVLAIEQRLNSSATRVQDPALGEDVKVMAYRRGDSIHVLLACAMVDGALRDISDYRRATERAGEIALEAARQVTDRPLTIEVNAGDDLAAERIYLTVTGTSAEAGDDGQAGRGNRVNGLITPCRPMTIESVAGKNPVTHVGKLYNIAASLIAERIVEKLPEIANVECRMLSSIGCPIDQPPLVELSLVARGGGPLRPELEEQARQLVEVELRNIPSYATQLLTRELRIHDWPLRR